MRFHSKGQLQETQLYTWDDPLKPSSWLAPLQLFEMFL